MKTLLCLLAITATVSSQLLLDSFERWKTAFRVGFTDRLMEEISRSNFVDNLETVIIQNTNMATDFVLELNEYADLSLDEFLKLRTGLVVPTVASGKSDKVGGPFGDYDENNAPESAFFLQYTLPVLNQGHCGSCWAFATMSQVESMLMIRDQDYETPLSPQYLLDCDWREFACNGGWPSRAMKWLRAPFLYQGGENKAPSLKTYKYHAKKRVCHKHFIKRISLGITDVYEINANGNENKMKAILASNGPVVIAIEVTKTFQLYKSGILEDSTANNDCSKINHAVVLVGYGCDKKGRKFWLVKNSWGKSWGEGGYVRIARDKNNQFNVACFAMFSQ